MKTVRNVKSDHWMKILSQRDKRITNLLEIRKGKPTMDWANIVKRNNPAEAGTTKGTLQFL